MRDVVVPVLSRSPVIQRRASCRMSQVYVSYPPGPLVRPGPGRGAPRAGQRMPDIQVRMDGQPTTLNGVLRGGRHVLVTPAAHAARMRSDPALQPYRNDLEIVTPIPESGDTPAGHVVLIRPDGHIAAYGKPGSIDTVTGYLHDLFLEKRCACVNADDQSLFSNTMLRFTTILRLEVHRLRWLEKRA